jgi:hypothetical protein
MTYKLDETQGDPLPVVPQGSYERDMTVGPGDYKKDGKTRVFQGSVSVEALTVENTTPQIPLRGVMAVIGTSTIGNATTTLSNGVVVRNAVSIWDRVNDRFGGRYNVVNYGYSGANNKYLTERLLDTVLPTRPAIVVLHWSANDLPANDLPAAEAAFESLKNAVSLCRNSGAYPIIVTPHLQTNVDNKWPTLVAYDTRAQEWGIAQRVPVISGAYSISANTDKIGTAKAGVMGDAFHINALGTEYYVEEAVGVLSGAITWRLLGGGNVEWSGQLHNNPRCTGSGAASGTGISGTRCANISPARFSGTPTCVCSVGTDAEGAYMDLEITFTAANDSIQVPEIITLARYKAGKRYASMCDLEILSGNFVRNIVLSNAYSSGNVLDPAGSLAMSALPVGRYTRRLPVYDLDAVAPVADTTHRAIIYGNAAGTSVVRCRALGTREVQA